MSINEERLKTIAGFINANMKKRNFNSDLGLEIESFDTLPSGEIIANFTYHMKEKHLNNYDAVHGGIIASIFDVAMGMGSAAIVNKMVTTTDMTFSFLRQAKAEEFRIVIEYGHVGKTIVNCTGKMYAVDENGEPVLCATALGNYFILDVPYMPPSSEENA